MAWRCKPQRTGSMPASELASLLVLVLMVDLLTSLDGFLGGLYNSIPPRQAQGAAPNLTLSNEQGVKAKGRNKTPLCRAWGGGWRRPPRVPPASRGEGGIVHP